MMGLKHLRLMEEHLRKHRGVSFTKTELRDKLGFNYNAVLDVLAYLLDQKKIVRNKKTGVEKYKWRG